MMTVHWRIRVPWGLSVLTEYKSTLSWEHDIQFHDMTTAVVCGYTINFILLRMKGDSLSKLGKYHDSYTGSLGHQAISNNDIDYAK